MTKTFLKWAVLLFAAFTMAVTFVSCEDEIEPDPEHPENPDNPDNPDQPGQFTFILNEKNVEIPAAGGAGKVTYTLENPIEGEEIQLTNEAQWLTDFSLDTPNEITFNVAANKTYEPRVADVKVKYSSKETLFTVKQLGEEMPDEEKFKIEISGVTETQYDVKVTPFDDSFTYASNVLTKDVYDKYESDEDLIIDDLEWYEYLAASNNKTMEEILSAVLRKGVYEEHMEENLSNTDYVYFAYGLTLDGEPTTEVYVEHFKTQEVAMVDADFEIEVTDVILNYATVNVNPKMPEYAYYYDIMSKKDYENIQKTTTLAQYTQAYLTDVMRKAYLHNETWEQALQNVVTMGPDSYTYEGVKSNDECIAYAMAVDQEGQVCSEPVIKEWKTYQAEMSENQITGELVKAGATECTIRWNTTTNDPYCMIYAPTSRFDGMNEAEKEDLIINFFGKDVILTGTREYTQMWLEPETSYTFAAFGWNGTDMTTDKISYLNVTTAAAGDPSTLTFEFEIGQPTISQVSILCKGTPADAGYICGLASARATVDDIKASLEMSYQFAKAMGQVKTYAEFIQMNTVRGNASTTFGIFQSLEYKAYAVGVYPETGEFATELSWSETFKAPDGIHLDTPVYVQHDKYYDAEDVFDAFPDSYAQNVIGKGAFALIPLTTVIDRAAVGESEDTYYFKWTAVMPTPALEGYSDMEIIYSISRDGNSSRVSLYNEWYLEMEEDYSILAVARQGDNMYTSLFREDIRLTKEGVSPLGDFVPEEIKNPMSKTKFNAMTMMNPFIQKEFQLAKGVSKDNIDRLSGRINTANSVEQQDAAVFTAPASEKKQSQMKSVASTVEFNGRVLNSAEKAAIR